MKNIHRLWPNGTSRELNTAGGSELKTRKEPSYTFFHAAFVYGEKAVNEALESDIPTEIKTIIQSARVYAEGRGFMITINDGQHTETLKKLVEIKLRH